MPKDIMQLLSPTDQVTVLSAAQDGDINALLAVMNSDCITVIENTGIDGTEPEVRKGIKAPVDLWLSK